MYPEYKTVVRRRSLVSYGPRACPQGSSTLRPVEIVFLPAVGPLTKGDIQLKRMMSAGTLRCHFTVSSFIDLGDIY